jgi:FKBP-type peptidyl-prolyl cis-trans isomerase SlyD
MQIEANKVVVFHYRLTDSEGSFAESSEGDEPFAYLHGHGQIVPGLESEMSGKRAGDAFQARIEPAQAYGERDPAATQRIPIKHLVRPGRLEPGQIVNVQTNEGERQVVVLKVGRFNVDVDLNHPLAGKTLIFDIEIVAVRDASDEEIEHGHVHGPGGHH